MASSSGSTSAAGAPISRKKISLDEWEKQLAAVTVNKADLNRLVMEFLVIEGYKDAAAKFAEESGTAPGICLDEIGERMKIRQAVQQGRIEEGISLINDLNPEILDSSPELMFAVKQQQLLEIIREGRIDEALAFAQSDIAPRVENNSKLLEETERTMALLAFDPRDVKSCPVGSLLSSSQRQKTANQLNAAILTSKGQDKDSKLPTILKMLCWSQDQLAEKVEFPQLSLNGEWVNDEQSSQMNTSR